MKLNENRILKFTPCPYFEGSTVERFVIKAMELCYNAINTKCHGTHNSMSAHITW